MGNIEFLVATTNRNSIDFVDNMNISAPVIIVNQSNGYSIEVKRDAVMITTDTIGVGINRNIGLSLAQKDYLLISDDDMVYYDNSLDIIRRAILEHPDADVIIFGFDYYKNGTFIRSRMKKSERIGFLNCLNYGICCTLIKVESIRKHNITFSTLFGGGSRYSCGEDSLFFLDCVRKSLNIHSESTPIGKNEYRESTWFKGYNEKFFFDKGAWIACAFPKMKWALKWYFVLRFRKVSTLSLGKMIRSINRGIKGYHLSQVYDDKEGPR